MQTVSCFHIKTLSYTFDWYLNTPLKSFSFFWNFLFTTIPWSKEPKWNTLNWISCFSEFFLVDLLYQKGEHWVTLFLVSFLPFSNKIWGNNFKTLDKIYGWGYTICYEVLHMGQWGSVFGSKGFCTFIFQACSIITDVKSFAGIFRRICQDFKTMKYKIINIYFRNGIYLYFVSCQTIFVVSEMLSYLWNNQGGYAMNSHVNW